jgi:recombination protein RecA
MTGDLNLICLDSVAAAMSAKELEASAEQKSMGGKAKAIGLMIGKITARLNDVSNPVKTAVIIINQVRSNISGYGNPLYTPGGMQLHFQTDIIVWLRKESEPVGGKENPIGITVKLRVEKNRTFPPFKTGNYDLLFIAGRVDNAKAVVEKAVAYGIIVRSGAWYEYKDIKAQGLDKCIESIVSKNKLEELTTEVLKLKDVAIDPDEEIIEQLKNMEA